jgi:glycopeptide antibiotics resistance protein
MFRRHPILTVVTFAYLGVVALITLWPQPPQPGQNLLFIRLLTALARIDALDWLTYSTIESLANVAMFVPIGVFFVLLFGRRYWWVAILAGMALTAAIETSQIFIPGRVPDVRDLVANSVGAAVGVIAALVITLPAAMRLRTRSA